MSDTNGENLVEYVRIKSGAKSARMLNRMYPRFVELRKAAQSPGPGWYPVEKIGPKPTPDASLGRELGYTYTLDESNEIMKKEYFVETKQEFFDKIRTFDQLKEFVSMAFSIAVPLFFASFSSAQTPLGQIDFGSPLYTASQVDAITTNINAAPVSLEPGQTDIDPHHDSHNGPVQIGEGAIAVADTSAVGTNTPIRSVSIAIGAGADARDLENPAKQQSIAIGNQARASGVNSLAIGSGVRHIDETDMTGGNAYALGAQAIALGYSAKSITNNAVQIGTGVNSEPHTLKFEGTTIVRNGKLATDGLDTNAVSRMIQAESEKGVMYGSTGSTNGFAYIKMTGYNSIQDTDPEFILAVHTNENADIAASFPIYPGSPNRRDVYSAATVDRKIEAAVASIGSVDSYVKLLPDSPSASYSNAVMVLPVNVVTGLSGGIMTGVPEDEQYYINGSIVAGNSIYSLPKTMYGCLIMGESIFTGNPAREMQEGSNIVALGSWINITNDACFVWNGVGSEYPTKGQGSFAINPDHGVEGFYIGNRNLKQIITEIVNDLLNQ